MTKQTKTVFVQIAEMNRDRDTTGLDKDNRNWDHDRM
jgi:hypothetical protein